MKAILLVSHGSQSPKTKAEISSLVNQLRQRSLAAIVDYAFLEIEKPSIPDGIENCIKKGAKQIVILLNFLNSGKHVDEDIPRIVQEAKMKYAQVQISITKPITQQEGIIDFFVNIVSRNNSEIEKKG